MEEDDQVAESNKHPTKTRKRNRQTIGDQITKSTLLTRQNFYSQEYNQKIG